MLGAQSRSPLGDDHHADTVTRFPGHHSNSSSFFTFAVGAESPSLFMLENDSTRALGRCEERAALIAAPPARKGSSGRRVCLSSKQNSGLSLLWHQTPYPSKLARIALADLIELSPRQVEVWFQNRRRAVRQCSQADRDVKGCAAHDVSFPHHSTALARSRPSKTATLNEAPRGVYTTIPYVSPCQEHSLPRDPHTGRTCCVTSYDLDVSMVPPERNQQLGPSDGRGSGFCEPKIIVDRQVYKRLHPSVIPVGIQDIHSDRPTIEKSDSRTAARHDHTGSRLQYDVTREPRHTSQSRSVPFADLSATITRRLTQYHVDFGVHSSTKRKIHNDTSLFAFASTPENLFTRRSLAPQCLNNHAGPGETLPSLVSILGEYLPRRVMPGHPYAEGERKADVAAGDDLARRHWL